MTKSFRGYVPIEAPSFDLESPDGSRRLTVHCNAAVPGSVFLDFMQSKDLASMEKLEAAMGDGGNMADLNMEDLARIPNAIYTLLQSCIRRDNWDAFKAFIDEPENGVSVEMLAEITGYLSEIYSKRPTLPPPPS